VGEVRERTVELKLLFSRRGRVKLGVVLEIQVVIFSVPFLYYRAPGGFDLLGV
jgi:hypothetical protein